jgi:hypothetical protein
MDHQDGTSSYTCSKDGKNEMYYNNTYKLYDPEVRKAQIAIRVKEVQSFITELSQPDYLEKRLGFPTPLNLDLSRLIISGHSFGGMTAIQLAKEDPRVKLCATLDPWVFPFHKEINAGEYVLSIPKIIVSTFHFHPSGEKIFPSW